MLLNWIRCHGEKNNVVYEMAKDKNVLDGSNELGLHDELIRSDGEALPVELGQNLSNLAFNIYEGEDYETEKESYDGSFGNFFAKK